MFDPDFERAIKTPELEKAELSYSNFMNKNRNKTLSADKRLKILSKSSCC